MKIFASIVAFAFAPFAVCPAEARLGDDPGLQFLEEDSLPPRLVDNPSDALGVDFLPGKRPKAQFLPNMKSKSPEILGLDEKIIVLDFAKAERINVFNPEMYKESDDGTFVTDLETGETIPLTVFFFEDEEVDGNEVLFALDDDSHLFHVRVTPKRNRNGSNEGKVKPASSQHFMRLPDGSNLLVGYMSDDVDLSKIPPLNEAVRPKEDFSDKIDDGMDAGKKSGTMRRGRRLQASTSTKTMYGQTCKRWDYFDVVIYTDRWFQKQYSSHSAHVQAIVAEAAEMYWKESCVHVYIWKYTATVWQDNLSSVTCSRYLANFRNGRIRYDSSIYRDIFHLFTAGPNFNGDTTIGCAYLDQCKNKDWGYGVNNFGFSNDLRLQAVLFAHEAGHNIGLNHISTTNGNWVMEPTINFAPFDLHPNNADTVASKILGSSKCGWY